MSGLLFADEPAPLSPLLPLALRAPNERAPYGDGCGSLRVRHGWPCGPGSHIYGCVSCSMDDKFFSLTHYTFFKEVSDLIAAAAFAVPPKVLAQSPRGGWQNPAHKMRN